MIKLRDIDVVFKTDNRTVTAVKNVSLDVNSGEIYGIVGYSGAGKSTLVRTINLLQLPTKGYVEVNGQDLLSLSSAQLRTARKKIGMIFQHFNLMESRTIAENVAFPLKNSGLSRTQKNEKVKELLTLVGLEDKLYNYPSQLSGGQKQRVAIARSLANDPDVLLCDEATSALDPKTTQSILDLLRDLNEKLGLTIVIITHEMAVVKDLCHKVAVMENGEILEQGQIVDIFTSPQKSLTKEFIDTATHFDREVNVVLEKIDAGSDYGNQHIVRITYVGKDTTQPVMAQLIRQYDLMVNILYGNVEVLQKTPVGNLLVAISGAADDFEAGIKFLQERNVKLEILAVPVKEEGGENELVKR